MTQDYTRTIYATDSASAQAAIKALAKRDGYRVRTVKAVRLAVIPGGPHGDTMPRYTVTLAVDAAPVLPDRSECG